MGRNGPEETGGGTATSDSTGSIPRIHRVQQPMTAVGGLLNPITSREPVKWRHRRRHRRRCSTQNGRGLAEKQKSNVRRWWPPSYNTNKQTNKNSITFHQIKKLKKKIQWNISALGRQVRGVGSVGSVGDSLIVDVPAELFKQDVRKWTGSEPGATSTSLSLSQLNQMDTGVNQRRGAGQRND